jgi:hypothetical protein
MPIEPLPPLPGPVAQTQKINEIVAFLNNIQQAGDANYLVWTGDFAYIPNRPPFLQKLIEGGTP